MFCEKNPCNEPHRQDNPPLLFFKNFQRMVVIVRNRDFDSMGKIHASLGPFESKGLSPRWVSVLWKNTHFETDFSLLIETIGSQVVVSMFTCSRRPPIFDLPGCHARVDLPNVNKISKLW